MIRTHSSRAVANYLLAKAKEDNNPLTPMQLIKLVYLCHGWMLGLYGRPLIYDPVEAWQYGPVIRDLYRAVRDFRYHHIDGPLQQPKDGDEFDEEERDVMDQVYNVYGHYSGIALSRLTHADGTPWQKTWERRPNGLISSDLIEEHFAELAA